MQTPQTHPQNIQGVNRRELLKAGLTAGVALSTWLRHHSPALWAAEAGQPKRGGILRVCGRDAPHFDPHLTIYVGTHTTLSFVYSKLARYRVGAGVPPVTLLIEPDVAEGWEMPDDMTYIFHLRQRIGHSNALLPQCPRECTLWSSPTCDERGSPADAPRRVYRTVRGQRLAGAEALPRWTGLSGRGEVADATSASTLPA